jgi:hypothetical protein
MLCGAIRLELGNQFIELIDGSFNWGIAAGVLLFFGVAMCLISGSVLLLLLAANMGLLG